MEVVRQQRGGGEWAGRPAAHLEPHACPLLPCQHPLHRCRSTAEPGLEPTPQKALSSHEFSSLIRSLTYSQGGESQSSDARVDKCPVWVPHFEGHPPHKEKRPGPSSRSLVYVLPPCRHGLSSSSRGRETPGRATRFPRSDAHVSAASRHSANAPDGNAGPRSSAAPGPLGRGVEAGRWTRRGGSWEDGQTAARRHDHSLLHPACRETLCQRAGP